MRRIQKKCFGEEEEEIELVMLDGDEDTLIVCIVERLLLEESCVTQWNSISRTRFTIKKNICEVIIDNGSCDNFVSRALIKALILGTEKHSRLYKLGWIKE